MSQPWDSPGLVEDPSDLWKDLKDAILPKYQQNGDVQVEEPDLIPKIKVSEPTSGGKYPPTSDESDFTDAQEELDTPSISEPREEQEIQTKEKIARFSNLPPIEGFESSDVVDFLSLADNAQVREKLVAILVEDEPDTTPSTKSEDDEPKLRKQGSWLSELTTALKSDTMSKDHDSEDDRGIRQLRRIRTELDDTSQQYEPKASDKGARPQKRHSWAADARASLRSFTSKAVQTENFEDDDPAKQPVSEVSSEPKSPKSTRSKRSNSWAPDIKAIFKSTDFMDTVEKKDATESDISVENIAVLEAKESISAWLAEVKTGFEPVSITEVIEGSDSQPNEENDAFENSRSAHVKSPESYWTLEVKTPLALAAVTKSRSNSEVMYDQVVCEHKSDIKTVEKTEPGRTEGSISTWIAEVEIPTEKAHELKLVPDDESGTDNLPEKQVSPGIDRPKKPNWVSPNQDAYIPMDGPNPTISWDFWAEEQKDTSKLKEVVLKVSDIPGYPMSRIALDMELDYHAEDWREDLP